MNSGSKQIEYHVRGRDNETYIFLDRDENGVYSVRSGTSVPSGHLSWEEDSSSQTVAEFLANNPRHREKVDQLIQEFESE